MVQQRLLLASVSFSMVTETQRWLTRNAAYLVLLGLLTGGFVAAAMTGKVNADVHDALASHLNALLGAFWMLGVAWSLPQVYLRERALCWMARLLVIAQYGNWIITAIKAFLHVSGVDATQDPVNNAVFVALNTVVVVPSLAAAAMWAWGLSKTPAKE